jgi:hypothetical protein
VLPSNREAASRPHENEASRIPKGNKMKEIREHGCLIGTQATEPGEVDMIAQGMLERVPFRDWTLMDAILVPATFSLQCTMCDAGDGINCVLVAEEEGWKNIHFDPTGGSYNYLGDCPGCILFAAMPPHLQRRVEPSDSPI